MKWFMECLIGVGLAMAVWSIWPTWVTGLLVFIGCFLLFLPDPWEDQR